MDGVSAETGVETGCDLADTIAQLLKNRRRAIVVVECDQPTNEEPDVLFVHTDKIKALSYALPLQLLVSH